MRQLSRPELGVLFAIYAEEPCDGIQQSVRAVAFGQKAIHELQSPWLVRRSRHYKNRDMRLNLLHLDGNFRPAAAGQEMIGNHEVDRILLENFQAFFAGRRSQNRVVCAGKQQFANTQGHLCIIDTQDEWS
jgi:hypothetical protein